MLIIRQQTWDQLISLAREGLPLEVCGYLAEGNGVIEEIFPIKNTDASAVHYTMDPEDQFRAIRQIRDQGLRLRSAYHSHPNTLARPSAEDIRLAYDESLIYVIISLKNNQPEVKSFIIRGGAATEEGIQIINGEIRHATF